MCNFCSIIEVSANNVSSWFDISVEENTKPIQTSELIQILITLKSLLWSWKPCFLCNCLTVISLKLWGLLTTVIHNSLTVCYKWKKYSEWVNLIVHLCQRTCSAVRTASQTVQSSAWIYWKDCHFSFSHCWYRQSVPHTTHQLGSKHLNWLNAWKNDVSDACFIKLETKRWDITSHITE